LQNTTTPIPSPVTVFQQFDSEKVLSDITAHMLGWMKPFKQYGVHYLPQGNRATVRKKFLHHMRQELSSLRPSHASGLATGNWTLNSGLTAAAIWQFVTNLYQTLGQQSDDAYTAPPLSNYQQQPKRQAYVFEGVAPVPKPKKEKIGRRGSAGTRKTFWNSSQRLNIKRRKLSRWAQAERKKSDGALMAFLTRLNAWLTEGQNIAKPNKEQRAYIAALKSTMSNVQNWLSTVKATHNPFNGGKRNAYIHWWKTVGLPELYAKKRAERLKNKAVKPKKLKMLKVFVPSNADITSKQEVTTAVPVKRQVKGREGKTRWVWTLETASSAPQPHQKPRTPCLVSETQFSDADIAQLNLLDPPSKPLPKHVQNTPPAKQKGPETTEAINEGRLRRKAGLTPYRHFNTNLQKMASSPLASLKNPEERRQQRGKLFWEAWQKENADLLQAAYPLTLPATILERI